MRISVRRFAGKAGGIRVLPSMTPAFPYDVCSPTPARSTNATLMPRLTRCSATDVPTIPAPRTIASARAIARSLLLFAAHLFYLDWIAAAPRGLATGGRPHVVAITEAAGNADSAISESSGDCGKDGRRLRHKLRLHPNQFFDQVAVARAGVGRPVGTVAARSVTGGTCIWSAGRCRHADRGTIGV